ncbi:MAG: hypothetical protein K6A92_09900 [Lachnospiraceae bacterium]|nr:hypothetical protein [Lachnospiraceae bacterium]
MASVIRAQLGLLIWLIDTTTGASVEENNVQFFADGTRIRPEPRGAGSFVLINTERKNFRLDTEVYGFEKKSMDVRYEELDDRIPTCVVFLIPSEKNAKGETVTSIFGNLPFLESLEALDPTKVLCRLVDFTEKTRKMSVIKQSGRFLDMGYGHYGLLQADGKSYEKITVSDTDSVSVLTLADSLKKPYVVNAPVCRVIFGEVRPNGDYLLRVRDDAKNLNLLLRYVVKGEEYFQQLDLHDPEHAVLDMTKSRSGSIQSEKEENS